MSGPIVPPTTQRGVPPLRGRELVALALALALIVATALLGRWQLGRAHEKKALAARIAERMSRPALALDGQTLDAQADLWRPVSARGAFAADWTVFLRNRPHGEQSGFWVLTPLRLEGRDSWVMVLRGWAPGAVDGYALQPQVPTPAGTVVVHGRVAPEPSHWFSLGAEPPQAVIRQNIDLAAFAAFHHIHLAPYVVQELGAPSDGLLRDWPQPDTGIATNYGYAVQWFAMTLLGSGLAVYFLLRRLTPRKPKQ